VVARAAGSLDIARTVERGVALTFDDGPHPDGTPAVLDLLDQAGAKATFFMVGEQVERRPQLAAEVAARGHVVALHANRHRLQMRMTARHVRADIERGFAAITAATGFAPLLHRPPYGVYSPAGLRTVRERGLEPLLWSQWGKDWRKHTTPQRIATRATKTLAPGDVILLHDADFYSAPGSHERTVEALKLIITELKQREIGTVLPV
jgi:peptidoglycan/xylan/chitin deacetylase (PgdA/CDA1 family)